MTRGRDLQAGQHAVAGRGVVGEDHVAGLFAAQVVVALAHALEHVPVPDAGFLDGDAGFAHGDLQAKVAHHRGNQGVVLQLAEVLHGGGHDRHDLVAVDDGSLVVHGQATVGVAVVGDSEVRAVFNHGCLQVLKVGGTVAVVDVDAVGFGTDDNHLGTRGGEDLRGAAAGSAVRAIQDDLHAVQAVRQGLQQVHDVAVFGIREAGHPSHVPADGTVLGLLHRGFDGVFERVVKLLAATGQELDAVVGRRVVRGGDHHAEVRTEVGHQVCGSRGGQCSRVVYVNAGSRKPRFDGSRKEVATDPGILGHHRHGPSPILYLFMTQHHCGGL